MNRLDPFMQAVPYAVRTLIGRERPGVRLTLAAEKALRSSEFISHEVSIVPELDHALEWCENEIIARHQELEGEEASLRVS